MNGVYVIGGQQRHARSMSEREMFWYKYHQGLILQVDLESGSVEQRLAYVSPPEVCAPDEPAILFKSATLEDGRLYACTQTEVLVYAVPDFELITYVSLPCFNDVHHVRPTPEGNLLVAISGLDMVVEVTPEGELLREWNTLGQDPWERFPRTVDYRCIESTKPHQSHPNQIFYLGNEIWTTRFEQRDAISLTHPDQRIPIDIERVHDGVVHAGRIYFTTVNGFVVIADSETRQVVEVIDLNELSEQDVLLGWCRGLHVDGDRVWVGFSRLRMTRIRQNLSWVRNRFRDHLPTRIVCYDLVRREMVGQIELQSSGLDAVFSILPLPSAEIDCGTRAVSDRIGVLVR